MKKFIYCRRDKKADFCDVPVFANEAQHEYEEIVARYLRKVSNPVDIATLNDCELLYLGSYDDVKVTFDLLERPIKCFDFGDYLLYGKES